MIMDVSRLGGGAKLEEGNQVKLRAEAQKPMVVAIVSTESKSGGACIATR